MILNKLKFILPVFLCIGCDLDAKDFPTSEVTRGISGIFLKQHELMTRNSWSSAPLDVKTVEKNIGRYDAIWSAQLVAQFNRPAWVYMRQKRPDQMMLHTVTGDTCRRTKESSYLDFEYILKYHPDWFLLNDTRNSKYEDYLVDDKRVRVHMSPEGTYYNSFYLDVANKEYQKWAAQEILRRVSGEYDKTKYSYTGLLMDNVHIGSRRMKQITNRHPYWKYGRDLKGWNLGYLEFLRVVKEKLNKHGFILIVNHNLDYSSNLDQQYWEILYDCVDGIATERSLQYARQGYYTNQKWIASIKRHEEILQKGLIDWWFCRPPEKGPDAYDKFLYSYCSWLLVKKPGKSLFHSKRGKHAYTNPEVPWYQEYELPI